MWYRSDARIVAPPPHPPTSDNM
eukprot:SAG31_NODE_35046_length_326_cov_2.185022_1_plen_22_part_01